MLTHSPSSCGSGIWPPRRPLWSDGISRAEGERRRCCRAWESNDPGAFSAISCAGVGDQLQVVGIAGGQLWHTIRRSDQSWQPFFGLIEGVESNNPGAFSGVGSGGVGDQLHVVGIV